MLLLVMCTSALLRARFPTCTEVHLKRFCVHKISWKKDYNLWRPDIYNLYFIYLTIWSILSASFYAAHGAIAFLFAVNLILLAREKTKKYLIIFHRVRVINYQTFIACFIIYNSFRATAPVPVILWKKGSKRNQWRIQIFLEISFLPEDLRAGAQRT